MHKVIRIAAGIWSPLLAIIGDIWLFQGSIGIIYICLVYIAIFISFPQPEYKQASVYVDCVPQALRMSRVFHTLWV